MGHMVAKLFGFGFRVLRFRVAGSQLKIKHLGLRI
jgi:hypothetical protein